LAIICAQNDIKSIINIRLASQELPKRAFSPQRDLNKSQKEIFKEKPLALKKSTIAFASDGLAMSIEKNFSIFLKKNDF